MTHAWFSRWSSPGSYDWAVSARQAETEPVAAVLTATVSAITSYADTGDEVEAAEQLVLDRLGELTEAGMSALAACREMFTPSRLAEGAGPDSAAVASSVDAPGSGSEVPTADAGAESAPM